MRDWEVERKVEVERKERRKTGGGAKKKDQTDGTKFSEKDQNDGTKFSGVYIKNTPKRTPHPIPI